MHIMWAWYHDDCWANLLNNAVDDQERPVTLELIQSSEEAEVVLDWKGDPMRISPGDKLPFKFL
jgi:hypothetical protein